MVVQREHIPAGPEKDNDSLFRAQTWTHIGEASNRQMLRMLVVLEAWLQRHAYGRSSVLRVPPPLIIHIEGVFSCTLSLVGNSCFRALGCCDELATSIWMCFCVRWFSRGTCLHRQCQPSCLVTVIWSRYSETLSQARSPRTASGRRRGCSRVCGSPFFGASCSSSGGTGSHGPAPL